MVSINSPRMSYGSRVLKSERMASSWHQKATVVLKYFTLTQGRPFH